MSKDIRVEVGLLGHRKTRKLERLIGRHESRSVLLALWLRVRLDRPDGILDGWDAEDVALACDWDGDADEFLGNLIASGWIDRSPSGDLVVHGWSQRQEYAAGERVRKEINRTNSLKRWLYRAGYSKADVAKMSPDEIRDAWAEVGKASDATDMRIDANGCEMPISHMQSQSPFPPSFPPSFPPPKTPPTPQRGKRPKRTPSEKPEDSIEVRAFVELWNPIARRAKLSQIAIPVAPGVAATLQKALGRKVVRDYWRKALELIDRRGFAEWVSERNLGWSWLLRTKSGGDGPPPTLAIVTEGWALRDARSPDAAKPRQGESTRDYLDRREAEHREAARREREAGPPPKWLASAGMFEKALGGIKIPPATGGRPVPSDRHLTVVTGTFSEKAVGDE